MRELNQKYPIVENKGITMVALMITVAILIILVSVSFKLGAESIADIRLENFYTQLEIVQKRVDDIAATNESYVNPVGEKVYLKDQGTAYSDLEAAKQTTLQNIINSEKIKITNIKNFHYFTTSQLEEILDVSEIDYDVFIDFDNRIVIAEKGEKIGSKTYYTLDQQSYFVSQTNKNVGTIQSLSYTITNYGPDQYKIKVKPSNIVGDVGGTSTVQYKKTTSNYWQISDNLEMIISDLADYNIIYEDTNGNKLTTKIRVSLTTAGKPTVTTIK